MVSDITMEDISKRERCKFYILYIKNWAQFMNAPIDKLHGLLIKTSNNLVGCKKGVPSSTTKWGSFQDPK